MNARQIFLLEFLLKQHEYLSANQLAEKYGVSTKTVYQDIDKLNDFSMKENLKAELLKFREKELNYLLMKRESKFIHYY